VKHFRKTLLAWLAAGGLAVAGLIAAQAPAHAHDGSCGVGSGSIDGLVNHCNDGYNYGWSVIHRLDSPSGNWYFQPTYTSSGATTDGYATLYCINPNGSTAKAFSYSQNGLLNYAGNVSCGCNYSGANGYCGIGKSYCGTSSACGNQPY
jgi:hypothetical protein